MNLRANWRWLLSVSTITVWAFLVLSLYYVVHKPFDLANVRAIGSAVLDFGAAGACVYIGIGLGSRCLPRSAEMTPLEELVLAASIGLGVLGLTVFALGLAGVLYAWLIWGLMMLGLVLSTRTVVRLLRGLGHRWLEIPAGALGRFAGFFVAASLLFSLLPALLPPASWDSLVYHLTGPKLHVQAHRFVADIDVLHLGFPALVEMLYTAGLILAGPEAAQVLHWLFAVLVTLLLYVFAERNFNTRSAWLAMAMLWTVPTLVLLASWAYVDIALMLYELAAVHAWLRWRESRQRSWLVVSGLLCGFAMSTKYTAIGLIFALVVLTLWKSRTETATRRVENVLFLGGPAFLVTVPWLLKNWAFLDNPVYPFLFGGKYWDVFRQSRYGEPGTGLAYTAPWRLLTAPWEMTIYASEGKTGFAATIGPLLLIGLPLLAAVWRYFSQGERSVLRNLLAIVLIQYAIWLGGVALAAPLMQTRLLFLVFPLLAVLAGCAFERAGALRRPAFAVDWILNIVFALSLTLNLLGTGLALARSNPLAYIAGWEPAGNYLEDRLGDHHTVMQHINRELPEDARVYFLWEPRSYYCDRECRPDATLDALAHLVYRFGDAAAVARYLQDQGFTHVLLYRQGLDFLKEQTASPVTEEDMAVLRELESDHLVEVYSQDRSYTLYRVRRDQGVPDES